VKLAVTARLRFIETEQIEDDPLQSPDHPENCQPDEDEATSVTVVPPSGRTSEQSLGQKIPGPVTVPTPLTETDRVKNNVGGGGGGGGGGVGGSDTCVKLAPTNQLRSIANVQVVLAPEHGPLQPANCQPLVGVSVRVTRVPPSGRTSEQSLGQKIPGPVTVPTPLTETDRVKNNVGGGGDVVVAEGMRTHLGPASTPALTTTHCGEEPEANLAPEGISTRHRSTRVLTTVVATRTV